MKLIKHLLMAGLLLIGTVLTLAPTFSASACASYSQSGNLTDEVTAGPWNLPKGTLIVVTIKANGGTCDDEAEGEIDVEVDSSIVKNEWYEVIELESFSMQYTLSHSGTVYVTIGTEVVHGDVSYSIAAYPDGDSGGDSVVPPDNRLNWRWGDHLAVIYPAGDADHPMLQIFGVGEDSRGYHMLNITPDDFAPFIDNPPAENTLITDAGLVKVYALSSGEFQISIGPDADGSMYDFVFNGLPVESWQEFSWSIFG